MTWLNTANYIPIDLERFWQPDTVAIPDTGPVAGVGAFRSSGGAHGVSFWQESSSRGMAAEEAAYKGDWTYEGFIYIYGLAVNHCLFAAGGWAGATEPVNPTAQVQVKTTGKLTTYWRRGAGIAVLPAADSAGALVINTWYHVGVVKDSVANTITYYINGALSSATTYAFEPTGGDSVVPFELRTSFGGYVSNVNSNNHKTACATFSTTKRDAAWMAASHAHLATDGILPTDASTWCWTTPILLSNIENDVNGPTIADGGGGAGGGAAPSIAVISPTPGVDPGDPGGFPADLAEAQQTPIVLDVDSPDGVAFVCVVCRYPGHTDEIVVYADGAPRGQFAARSSSELVTATKLRITVIPEHGWPDSANPADIVFDVDAFGGDGSNHTTTRI